jgi:hypothetical protein
VNSLRDVLEALYVDLDGIVDHQLAKPFARILDDDLFARLEREMKNPDTGWQGRGSKESVLVEMMGLEPTTSSMPWRRSTRLSYIPETAQSTSG